MDVAEILLERFHQRPTRTLADAEGFEPNVNMRDLYCVLLSAEFEPLTVATGLFANDECETLPIKTLIGVSEGN